LGCTEKNKWEVPTKASFKSNRIGSVLGGWENGLDRGGAEKSERGHKLCITLGVGGGSLKRSGNPTMMI